MILYILLCGYPPFDGDNNKEIFRSIMRAEVEFDPEDWATVSEEAIDLIKRMLNKDQTTRINLDEVINHPWLQKFKSHDSDADSREMSEGFMKRLRNY